MWFCYLKKEEETEWVYLVTLLTVNWPCWNIDRLSSGSLNRWQCCVSRQVGGGRHYEAATTTQLYSAVTPTQLVGQQGVCRAAPRHSVGRLQLWDLILFDVGALNSIKIPDAKSVIWALRLFWYCVRGEVIFASLVVSAHHLTQLLSLLISIWCAVSNGYTTVANY